MKRIALAVVVLLLNTGAGADESQLRLVDAPGRDRVLGNCSVCHSVDYVLMSAGIPDRKGWEASIGKMRKVMGASISDADSAVILDYLASNYSSDPPGHGTARHGTARQNDQAFAPPAERGVVIATGEVTPGQ